jgi:hypothetical protein
LPKRENNIVKQRLVAFALVLTACVPSLAFAQTTGSFNGKWEGTFKMQRTDGTEGNPSNVEFNLTQKGKVITGTAGPGGEKVWPIEKGVVDGGKASFQVQQPDGPLFKFTLSIEKGHLVGDMAGQRDGVVRGHAKVDAPKAAKPAVPAKK